MEVSDVIDPAEFQLLNVIVKVLAAKNLPNVLLFLYKSPTGEYGFVNLVPEGATVDKEFIAKFNELASNVADSMAILPKDNFVARMTKLVNKWRIKGSEAIIEKANEDGVINIKFK